MSARPVVSAPRVRRRPPRLKASTTSYAAPTASLTRGPLRHLEQRKGQAGACSRARGNHGKVADMTYKATKIERPSRRSGTCFVGRCPIVRGGPQIGWVPGHGWGRVDCIVAANRSEAEYSVFTTLFTGG